MTRMMLIHDVPQGWYVQESEVNVPPSAILTHYRAFRGGMVHKAAPILENGVVVGTALNDILVETNCLSAQLAHLGFPVRGEICIQ